MSDNVHIDFDAQVLGRTAFWRLVRWCHAAGASEFTVDADGSDMDDMKRVWLPVEQALRQFERPAAVREIVKYCVIEEGPTDLWELCESSIEVLEAGEWGDVFVPPSERQGKRTVEATLHYLSLYRNAVPMLAMYQEQGAYVGVTLSRDELEQFRAQGFVGEVKA